MNLLLMPLHHPLVRTGVVTLLLVTLVSHNVRALLDMISQILLRKIAITIWTVANPVIVPVSLYFLDILTLKCASNAPVQLSILWPGFHFEGGRLRLTIRGHWVFAAKGFKEFLNFLTFVQQLLLHNTSRVN